MKALFYKGDMLMTGSDKAINVSYDNSNSSIVNETVQEALDELSYHEVTQAEYDALGDKVLTDGIVYLITDSDITYDLRAGNIDYDDTKTQIGVTTVQSAIEYLKENGGGGGTASVIELESVEDWEALPDSKYTDGKIYKINSSGTTISTIKEIPYSTWETMSESEKVAAGHVMITDAPEGLTVAEVNEKVENIIKRKTFNGTITSSGYFILDMNVSECIPLFAKVTSGNAYTFHFYAGTTGSLYALISSWQNPGVSLKDVNVEFELYYLVP